MATNLKTELNAARHRVEALEVKREALHHSHCSAVDDRRKLLLSDNAEEKLLLRSDAEVSRIENSLAGLEDALVIGRAKVTELTSALEAQRDQEQRDAKATAIEAGVIPRLQDGIAGAASPLKALIAELDGCGIPEGKGAALLTDSWEQVVRETAKIIAELGADARRLRITPTSVKPSAPPTPQLQAQPFRKTDLPDAAKFVDWDHAR